MAKYLKLFKTTLQYNEYINGSDVVLPNVSVAKVAPTTVYFNPYDYSKVYLTFVALEDGTFTFRMSEKLTTAAVPSMSYSTDNGKTWTTVQNIDNKAVTVTTPTITSGNKVLWKSNAVQYSINPDPYPGGNMGQSSFSSTSTYNIEGNIMSLMYGDDFKGKTSFKTPISNGYRAGTFCQLFTNNQNIISVDHLVLPATTLEIRCYEEMFKGCTSLTTAPVLPATTLVGDNSYSSMFEGCTSLTTAPELPATTLGIRCYESMFKGCTSLTTAPVLPATTLEIECYVSMFSGCTSLTTAPELLATTLTNRCYEAMFKGCTKLNYIKAMFITTPSASYASNWVNGVAATGTFVKNSAATWNVRGVNGIPSGWTITTASA